MDLHHGEDVRARDHHHQVHHHQQQQQQQLVLRERGRRIKAAAELGLARSSQGRQWGRALGRRRALVMPPEPEEEEVTSTGKRRQATPLQGRGVHHEEGEEDEVVVEEKVALLRQLVPGGEDMAVEGLLEETADYIAALEKQVGVMRALTRLLSAGSDLDAASAAGLLTLEKPM